MRHSFGIHPWRGGRASEFPRRSHTEKAAFSVLELLVAMAVLSIVLVMVVQIMNGVLASTRTQNAQMDSVAEARRALDVMESDFGGVVVGRTVTVLVPDAIHKPVQLAFAAARRGPDSAASTHRFLAVAYATNSSNGLVRSYRSLSSTEPDLLNALAAAAAPGGTNDASMIGEGILAWQIRAVRSSDTVPIGALLDSGAATTNYYDLAVPAGWAALVTREDAALPEVAPVRTLEIWMAAIGQDNLQLIDSTGARPAIVSALAGNPEGWREALDASPGIPGQIKSAIRVLKKVISLP